MILKWRNIILLLLIGTCIRVSGQQNLLDRKVTIDLQDVSVREALEKLKKETKSSINFRSSELPNNRKITRSFYQVPIRTIIKEIWGTQQLMLRATGNTISIKSTPRKRVEKEKGNLVGLVTDDNREPIPFATISIKGTGTGVITDVRGRFQINQIYEGEYILSISSAGYQTNEVEASISDNQTTELSINLSDQVSLLDEVVVVGKTIEREISEQPIQVSSIDVKPLQRESSEVVKILNRTTGVRIRQSGGLGSPAIIQLNGLSDKAVRIYYDGIPLELYGSAMQLNNIPATNVDRIDVYKGVMPIDVGTDALAGGINVISKQIDRDHLDISYQIGSFNTHVLTINANKKLNKHFMFSLSGFYNYSDNDYTINATQRLPDFTEIQVEVERFHDAHESGFASISLGLLDTDWTDELIYSFGLTGRKDEFQHGVRLASVPAGEAFTDANGTVHNVLYKKKLFKKKLSVHYFGSLIHAKESTNDSTRNRYDWFGNVTVKEAGATNFSEILATSTLRNGETSSLAQRLNIAYGFNENHLLKLSSFQSHQSIKGEDTVQVLLRGFDPNKIPSTLDRWINGISYEGKWLNTKLESVIFGKHYYYRQRLKDIRSSTNEQVLNFEQEDVALGYGLGFKYIVSTGLFVRSSFESSLRIPSSEEVFGDFISIEPNFLLQPETSKNLNVGANYKHSFDQDRYFLIDFNFFIRKQKNLIRIQPGRVVGDPAQYVNETKVDGTGLEVSFRISPIKNFEFVVNSTFQKLNRGGEEAIGNTNGVGFPVPNIPQRFFNLEGRYKCAAPWSEHDELSVFSYFNFIDEFDFVFQPVRNEDNIIPTQKQLDFGVNYLWKKCHSGFSFQINNLLDEEVFDNYRVPKPRRNFSFKITYDLQKL